MTAVSQHTRDRLSVPRWCYGGTTASSHYALSRGCPCCGNMGPLVAW